MERAWWFVGQIANLEGEGVIQGQALESSSAFIGDGRHRMKMS
jgi:hypothetical protein